MNRHSSLPELRRGNGLWTARVEFLASILDSYATSLGGNVIF